MELDKDGRRPLKDEAKNRKQREREKKKKGKGQGEKASQEGAKAPEAGESKKGQAGGHRPVE